MWGEGSGLQYDCSEGFARWLAPRLTDGDPVHAHMFGGWWAAARAAPAGVPLVASEHNAVRWPGPPRGAAYAAGPASGTASATSTSPTPSRRSSSTTIEERFDERAVAEARGRLDTAYGMLEAQLAANEFLAGDTFTIADCAAAPGLFYALADELRELPRAGCAGWRRAG